MHPRSLCLQVLGAIRQPYVQPSLVLFILLLTSVLLLLLSSSVIFIVIVVIFVIVLLRMFNSGDKMAAIDYAWFVGWDGRG